VILWSVGAIAALILGFVAIDALAGDNEFAGVTSPPTPLHFNAIGEPITATGTLSLNDEKLGTSEFVDVYTFDPGTATRLVAEMSSPSFDTWIFLNSPDGSQIAFNDDFEGSNRVSRLEVPLQGPGIYGLYVTSKTPGETGAYTLIVTPQ